MSETARKYKMHKVRCLRCGHVSWWRSDHRYECAKCGSKKASAVDLVREALREQRAEVQRRLVAKKRMDAFFNGPLMKNKRVLLNSPYRALGGGMRDD